MTERAMDAEIKDFEKYHRAHIFVSLLIWQLDDAMDCLQDRGLLTGARRNTLGRFRQLLEQILSELEVVLERIKYSLKQFQALF